MAMHNFQKTCKLTISTVIAENKQETLLQPIQSESGVLRCTLVNRRLILRYDLQLTSLQQLLPKIEAVLQLNSNIINLIKIKFICFVEANQRDNMNKLSGWHLRLQDIYLAMANRHHENHHLKTPHQTIPTKKTSRMD